MPKRKKKVDLPMWLPAVMGTKFAFPFLPLSLSPESKL
jgi:hypothetical protein